MRRFVTLTFCYFSRSRRPISGCSKNSTIFCNGSDSGIPVGQVNDLSA
jgi:hypothetical protein